MKWLSSVWGLIRLVKKDRTQNPRVRFRDFHLERLRVKENLRLHLASHEWPRHIFNHTVRFKKTWLSIGKMRLEGAHETTEQLQTLEDRQMIEPNIHNPKSNVRFLSLLYSSPHTQGGALRKSSTAERGTRLESYGTNLHSYNELIAIRQSTDPSCDAL